MIVTKSAGNQTSFLDAFRHLLTSYFVPGSGSDPGDVQICKAQPCKSPQSSRGGNTEPLNNDNTVEQVPQIYAGRGGSERPEEAGCAWGGAGRNTELVKNSKGWQSGRKKGSGWEGLEKCLRDQRQFWGAGSMGSAGG